MELSKYSVGVGDRFAHQSKAQLQACILAGNAGVEVIPVWNKSNREHTIIGSEPSQTRLAVDAAVKALGWTKPYFCDADHITLATVDRFLAPCDFYTIDVADYIGKAAEQTSIDAFVARHGELLGKVQLEGVSESLEITPELLRATATKFLFAVQEAGKVYRKIESVKGAGNFVPEVSMDETDAAQSPLELLIILAAIADEKIPLQTIAPKFSGRFNKGVEYVGDVEQFEREMALDIAAIQYAIRQYGLPKSLKLSVHSGSDKFSIYPAIHRSIRRFDTGVHLKTAGTTWLEELIGLAEAGGEGLVLAKEIYSDAYDHREELCVPYATVIDIHPDGLPTPGVVKGWSSDEFTSALRHDQSSPLYNPNLRQLLHVGFKIAAKKGSRYIDLLEANEAIIAKNVTENIFNRHLAPVFLGRSIKAESSKIGAEQIA
ncbi:tagaturonate epimerase family protein [Silvibacterium sp.]|uniref:tagaturonate epimerase family protein n=1 Tax=Silvibacterium sp. TaxID=1964179 RepID=UPI0039E55AE9